MRGEDRKRWVEREKGRGARNQAGKQSDRFNPNSFADMARIISIFRGIQTSIHPPMTPIKSD